MKNYYLLKINPIIFLIVGLFFLSCSSHKNDIPEDQIVARVGERIITKEQFKSSFEFSFAPLRTGTNPREVYLNYMIKELLISNEGYTKGLNKSRYVTNRVKNRLNNNLLEAFYLNNVHRKVKIPEEKIIDALKKSTIKFRLRILPTKSLQKAAEAYDAANESSLEEYIDKEISKLEIKNVDKKNFETDWMDFMEMRPEVFSVLQNLEIGKPSKPIQYNNGYAIFEVIDINREAIKSDELIAGPRRKKIEARLHNIEADKISHELMDSILTPQNVKLSSKSIDQMIRPLYAWIYDGIPKKGTIVSNINAATDTSKAYLIELKKLLQQKLYSAVDGTTTIEDYFQYMNYHRKVINESKDPLDLKNRLIEEIGNMIKNNKYIQLAKEEGYLDSINITKDITLWEQKWTYDVYRDKIITNVEVTQDEMKDFFEKRWRELRIANVDTTRFYKYEDDVYNFILFEKHSALLENNLSDLKEKYQVKINHEVLKSIKLNDGPKAQETSLFVVKNFSGEFVVPTADMQWLNY